jgi:hypothetical protein
MLSAPKFNTKKKFPLLAMALGARNFARGRAGLGKAGQYLKGDWE